MSFTALRFRPHLELLGSCDTAAHFPGTSPQPQFKVLREDLHQLLLPVQAQNFHGGWNLLLHPWAADTPQYLHIWP